MKTTGNTILITGGATGIGLALVRSFLEAGNEVIICGRKKERLAEAKSALPQLTAMVCDVADEEARRGLAEKVRSGHPKLNILINNAGVQRPIDFRQGPGPLLKGESEIDINLKGPVYLSAHFIPLLSRQKEAAIVNVSSGLGFAPIAFMPVYCATKAAVHSFTMSLRHQLKDTSIKVFELIPPRVDTDLGMQERQDRGSMAGAMSAEELAAEFMQGFAKDVYEIAAGQAKNLVLGSRKDPDVLFRSMNAH